MLTSQPGLGSAVVIAFDMAGLLALQAVPPSVQLAAVVEASHGECTDFPCVWLDDGRAANLATRFLLDLGHRTVHYVAIPSSTGVSARMDGWRTALEEVGAPLPEPVPAGWTKSPELTFRWVTTPSYGATSRAYFSMVRA